jgi:hypothetical protein
MVSRPTAHLGAAVRLAASRSYPEGELDLTFRQSRTVRENVPIDADTSARCTLQPVTDDPTNHAGCSIWKEFLNLINGVLIGIVFLDELGKATCTRFASAGIFNELRCKVDHISAVESS